MTQRIKEKSKVESRKSRAGKALMWLLLLTFNFQLSTALAATKVFLRSADTKVSFGSPDHIGRLLNSTQGATMVSSTMNSIAGPLTGHYWPISTAGYIFTPNAGTSTRVWISAPLSAGVTISGTITPNLWGKESNVACNCAFRYEVLCWNVSQGGIVSSLGISTDSGVTEWGTTAAVRTTPTLTPTSTTFVAGDRIVIIIYNDDGNGVTEGSGRTWTLDFEGPTGVDGDTYFSFTESISFSADSNNARPLAVTSRVRQLTDFPLLPFYFDQWRIRRLTDSEPGNRR